MQIQGYFDLRFEAVKEAFAALFTPAGNVTDAANTIAIASGSFTDLSANPGTGGQSDVDSGLLRTRAWFDSIRTTR